MGLTMQAFEGIRVVDFTHVLAGPFCTYQLAVMGADVIKIESPAAQDMMRSEGVSDSLADEGRGTQYLAQSANKRSLLVDFSTKEGRQIILSLIRSADVLVENFRGGVMAKVGLDYDSVKEINSQLIYCSMTGFGQTGPKAQHPAYDNVIQAFSGLMAHTGTTETAPVRVGPPVLDYGTGAQAAFAVSAALFQRSRTGTGQRIDVAMLDAALMLMSTSVVDTQVTGKAPVPPGNSSPSYAAYACFDTPDGQIMIGAFTAKQQADLWQVLNQPALAELTVGLGPCERAERVDQDRALIAELLMAKSAQHWEDVLNDAGVPAARVRQLDEALGHQQVASRQVMQTADGLGEDFDQLKTPVAAFSFEHDGPDISLHGARPGQHSVEILSELGYTQEQISALQEAGAVGQG